MSGYPWGGSEELWSQAASRLRDRGHDVSASVVWWPTLSPRIEHLRSRGIPVFVAPPPGQSLWQRVQARLLRRQSPAEVRRRWLRQQQGDLVCVSNGNYRDGLPLLETCLDSGIPYVSVVQANGEVSWPTDAAADQIRAVYQGARCVFFVSHANRSLLETQLGIHLTNAEVVRNPYNVRWEASPAWPDESGGFRLACVARLEPPAKGQDVLLHVLASPKWRARPLSVCLVGSGPMEAGLRRLVTYLGVQDRVRFAGQVSDVERVWAQHHAVVLPSRYEGLPLALVEAMLCGRPAIITAVGGNAEVVEDGLTGFVAPAPTIALLDEALERAWQRRGDWALMGAHAARRIRELVPQDPAGVFADRLLQIGQGCRTWA